MANVEETRNKFFEAKKSVEDCQRAIAGLQTKRDTLGESLPGLSRAVEDAEKTKTTALDSFALSGNKQTEQALKVARQANEAAQKAYSESNELVEATARALKKRESELPKLHTQADLQKRACWESIASEIRSRISEGVISDIQHLVVASMQCSKTKQFVISELFPNLNPSEYQTMRDELSTKYSINE